MRPILADGIDLPLVLGLGLAVLVPLLLFEVCVEAWVLKRAWSIRFGELCGFTFWANCFSLLAGIPVKILNAILYSFFLPEDLPGFFARYPLAVGLGTFAYFCVTVVVEGGYAFRWLRSNGYTIARNMIWKGIFLANLASYAVVAPLHYYFTRPLLSSQHQFVRNTAWTAHPTTRVLFIDGVNQNLKCIRLDGSAVETVVPIAVRDYLVSADLKKCLFRDPEGHLCLYQPGKPLRVFPMPAQERLLMSAVAFSPSGEYIAYAIRSSNLLSVADVETGRLTNQRLDQKSYSSASVVWSTNESKFYVADLDSGKRLQFTIQLTGWLLAEPFLQTNPPDALTCYGGVGDDWGAFRYQDSCADCRACAESGLGSYLAVYQGTNSSIMLDDLAVNSGLLHLADFVFGAVAFIEGCEECLFEANGYLYVLNVREKKVGTLVRGERFVLMTPNHQKQLQLVWPQ